MERIDDRTFRQLLLRARVGAALDDRLYWRGYRHGLHHLHEGERADGDHAVWLSYIEASDPVSAELGRGYRDGMNGLAPQI